MRTPALLLVGLLAATALPTTASALECHPLVPTEDFHCTGDLVGVFDVDLHYHPFDGERFNDYVELCFKNGDPTGGLIGDCRGALLPSLA